MNCPIISVIMPVYNAEAYLSETIRSIQDQTFSDFEVICVNDGSTDGSVSIIEQTAAQDTRFRLLHQPNGGAGVARNHGFRFARGEYAIFLDSDDLFSPQLLEKLYKAITENQADIAACNFSKMWADGTETQHKGVHTEWIPRGAKVFNYLDCPDYILRVINPTPWNKLYRSAFIRDKELKYEPLTSTNDITFAALSVAAAERVTYIEDSLVRYRASRPGSISSGKHKKLNNARLAVESTARQARELPHSDVIENAVLSFVVDNFITALKGHIKDFSDPDAANFYRMVHETFNRPEYANISAKTLHNEKQYREFCTVRKHGYEKMKELISRRLILSLTTYPKRIGLIPNVLRAIYRQNKKPDEIVLWLAEEQFPAKEAELPAQLLEYVEEGKLTIRWCDDLKPHKKYFYALQEYADDLVVTVDDDLWYTWNTLATLYESYLLYPEAVSTVRAHLIMIDEEKRIMPYSTWIQETDICIHKPSMQLLATGGAGVLYPPHLFRREMFDKQAILENCPWADDLWLKAMQLVSDVPVVLCREHMQLQYLDGSQEEALHHINVRQNQNDVQLRNIDRWLSKTFEQDILIKKLTTLDIGEKILGIEAVANHLNEERKALRRKVAPAESKVRQMEGQLKQANARVTQAEERLQQMQSDLKQTQVQLKQAEQKQKQTDNKLRQVEDGRKQAENKLQQTRKQLRQVEESKPISRQLKEVGTMLRSLKEKGHNPVSLAFKYCVYYLAWIPEKLLAFLMYYLKHGFTHTLKHAFRKLFRRG